MTASASSPVSSRCELILSFFRTERRRRSVETRLLSPLFMAVFKSCSIRFCMAERGYHPEPCHSEERSDEESALPGRDNGATVGSRSFAALRRTGGFPCHSEERSDEESALPGRDDGATVGSRSFTALRMTGGFPCHSEERSDEESALPGRDDGATVGSRSFAARRACPEQVGIPRSRKEQSLRCGHKVRNGATRGEDRGWGITGTRL